MSGLLAWTGSDPGAQLGAFRARLRAMAARGPAAQREHALPAARIGAALDDPGDIGQYGAFTVALDGHPSNLRALTAEQVALERAVTTPAEVVASLCDDLGVERALARLEGTVALIAHDARDGSLWAARDRMGARPLHLVTEPDGAWVGTDLGGAAVDPDALDALVRTGGIEPPRALYVGVRQVPPGHLVRVDGRSAPRPYWSPPALEPGRGGARVRWVQSLEFAARMCVRQAEAAGERAVWVEDTVSAAVLAASQHPVTGPLRAIVVAVDGVEGVVGGDVLRATLDAAEVEAALEDLAAAPEPAVSPDALLYWAVARRAEASGIAAVLTGRGAGAWLAPQPARRWLRGEGAPQPPPGAGPDLRTADAVSVASGTRFLTPLADPRLVALGRSVPAAHHAAAAPELWAAMGAAPVAARAAVPLRAWLTGPLAPLVAALPKQLADRLDAGSLAPLIAALPGSDAAAARVYALLAIERHLRAR